MTLTPLLCLALAAPTFDTPTSGGAPPPGQWTNDCIGSPDCECRCVWAEVIEGRLTCTAHECRDSQDGCDLGEVLAAARAVEPFLRVEPCYGLCSSDGLYHIDLRTEPQKMRDEADALEREIAAVARLRRALAACPVLPERHDDGDQKNPVQLHPEPNQQPKEKP